MAPVQSVTILYPDNLPLEDAKEIIRIFRDGVVLQERAMLAKHVWVLQGYAQGALLGDPDNLRVFSASDTPANPVDPIALLEQLVAQEEARLAGQPTAQALPLSLAFLLEWAIKKLIELLVAELGITF